MWRALFLAIGIWLCMLGAQCLVVERAVLAETTVAKRPVLSADMTFTAPGTQPSIETREWMPFTFLGLGVVIILYTFTLPRRNA
jgi:hypothetical protein